MDLKGSAKNNYYNNNPSEATTITILHPINAKDIIV